MDVRRASREDAAKLSKLARKSKAYWGYRQSDLERWREQLTVEADDIDRHEIHLLEHDGEPVGFYALKRLNGTLLDLDHFWIAPDKIGQGLGRRLFEHLRLRAVELGAQALRIDSDPHAEGFYLAVGAIRTGEVPAPIAGEPRRVLPRLRLTLRSR